MFLLLPIQSGRLLDETLSEIRMSHKEARFLCGYTDDAQFSRALTGERPLDMHKVERLPWDVFAKWFSKLIAAKAVEHSEELRAARVRMVKADLLVTSERKAG